VKVLVDRTICCSYGVCVETVPEVFSFDDDARLVIVEQIPAALGAKVRFACESCPSQALLVEEDIGE
jgi:ferredoxin